MSSVQHLRPHAEAILCGQLQAAHAVSPLHFPLVKMQSVRGRHVLLLTNQVVRREDSPRVAWPTHAAGKQNNKVGSTEYALHLSRWRQTLAFQQQQGGAAVMYITIMSAELAHTLTRNRLIRVSVVYRTLLLYCTCNASSLMQAGDKRSRCTHKLLQGA